jgi:hypothetical protein
MKGREGKSKERRKRKPERDGSAKDGDGPDSPAPWMDGLDWVRTTRLWLVGREEDGIPLRAGSGRVDRFAADGEGATDGQRH